MCFAAEACRHVGNIGQARVLYDLLSQWGHLSAAVSIFSVGSVERSLGVLATQLGDQDRAEHHLLRAIDKNRRGGSPPWTATARVDLAELCATRGRDGDIGRLRRLVADARDDVDGLGADRVTRRATGVLERRRVWAPR